MGKLIYWLVVATGWCVFANAQSAVIDSALLPANTVFGESFVNRQNSATPFVIGKIYIEGNKKTKPYIIERELPFKEGDSVNLPKLVEGFTIARQQLMNTTLFNDVVVALKAFRGYEVDVLIEVKERWYIFPIPYIKPIDRNLAEWVKQGFGVDRLNYGFKFNYNNFTGRNDKLKIWLITGYSQQIQFLYEQPYADATLKHGYKVGFSYTYNKEINYATIDNEQMFTDTLAGTKRWYAHVDYTYRPGLRTFNAVRLGFVQLEVDSQVFEMNPKYFSTGKSRIRFPELSYSLNYYKVDYIPYPLTGWMGEASFLKRGIFSKDMDMWQISGKFLKGWELGKKTYFGWQANGVLRVPFDQPFINQRLFGYSDFYLRGLENYVVDGIAGVLFRHTFRREILRFNIPTFLKSKSHDIIPFRFYIKAFGDVGYAHNPVNPENSLTNRMMYTAGTGIDMISFYDFVLRFEYSFNQLGQSGLFLHIRNDF